MRLLTILLTLIFCIAICETSTTNHTIDKSSGHHGISLASWRWSEYGDIFVMLLMITLAAVSKVVFHEVHYLSKHFPESCVLILLGLVVGCVVHFGLDSKDHHFPE